MISESEIIVNGTYQDTDDPFDFVIEELKIIIEIDGPQHFIQVANWTSPEIQKEKDKYKINCANENGFSVIRLLQIDILKNKYDWIEELKDNISKINNEQKIIIGGIIESVKEIITKKGDKMAFLTIRDFTSAIEAVIFPKTYTTNKDIILIDTIVAVQATVSDRDGQKSIIINGIKKLEKK